MKKNLFLGSLCLAFVLVFFTSCNKEDDPAPPVIAVSPIDTAAGTGEIVSYRIKVKAEAGLADVKLNSTEIKSYTESKSSDEFTYEYTYTASEAVTLVFTVTDNDGNIETVNTQVGWRLPQNYYIFKLDDQVAIDSAELCEGWFCGTFPVYNLVSSDFASNGLVWQRGTDIDETAVTGVQAPAGGVSMKIDRTNAPWGGWSMYMFQFPGKFLPVNEVSALKDGSRILAMDVYFEQKDTDPAFSFDAMSDSVYMNPASDDPIKVAGGLKFQIRLINTEKWVANQNVTSYIHEAYLTEPGVWQTIYFDLDEVETQIINDALIAAGVTTKVLDTEVDGFVLITNYQCVPEKNNYYIRNIRFTYPQ